MISGIFVAHYNFKTGMADTKGAFKLLIFVFGALMLPRLLIGAKFSSAIFSLSVIRGAIQEALLIAIALWIGYLAIEPFVRKYWANLSVSWIRLMAGDFRDPMVGRDILIGGLFGLLHTTTIYCLIFISKGVTFDNVAALLGWRGILGTFGGMIAFPIFFMSLMLLLVIILTVVFRRRWLALAGLWFLQFLVVMLLFFGNVSLTEVIGGAIITTIMTVPLIRFGMLAFFVYFIFFNLSHGFPLTTDVSAWYFNATIFAAVVIIGLASYGFYTSIAGQPVFQGKILGEENT